VARIGVLQCAGIVTFSVIVTGGQELPRVRIHRATKEKPVKNN
jgi:hypothetical protein